MDCKCIDQSHNLGLILNVEGMVELMDLAWDRETHLGLDLNGGESMMQMTSQHQWSSFFKPMGMANYYQISHWSL